MSDNPSVVTQQSHSQIRTIANDKDVADLTIVELPKTDSRQVRTGAISFR